MEGLQDFFKVQTETLKKLQQEITVLTATAQLNKADGASVPFPKPLEVDNEEIIKEKFDLFKSNWQTYQIATGMNKWQSDQEEQKVNILWSMIGDAAKLKYNNFGLTDSDKVNAETMLKKIDERIVFKKHAMYERWLFHTCNQLDNEAFDQYFNRLNKAVDGCQFESIDISTIKEIMVRDRIAFGIKDEQLKKKFLKDDPEKLTLEEVIKQCRVNEVTEDRYKLLRDIETKDGKTVYKINKRNIEQLTNKRKCKFCNNLHTFEKNVCPAINKECRLCKRKGHFEICCYSQNKKFKQNRRKVHTVNEDNNSDDNIETFKINCVQKTTTKNTSKAKLKLKFGNKWSLVDCDLDTGAEVCLIGYNYLKKMLNTNNIKLRKSQCKLKAFGGNVVNVKGEIDILCERKNKKYYIIFQVVDVEYGPLLSENACLKLEFIKYCRKVALENDKKSNEVDLKIEAERLVNEYKDIFEGYGKLQGEVELEIDENVPTVIQKARRVPINLRNRLKKELDQLVKDEIIVKEDQHTDWVSNILIVQKQNSFRICIDPIPLNKALKRSNRQFSTIDEILPELGKAKVFSKMDAKKGFWQLALTDESSKLTCFWTPFGRYRWLRLPFGVSSAPELFQMKMAELVDDLNGVEVMADDILIYGSGDSYEEAVRDHNINLKNLFERCRQRNCKLNRSKLILCQKSVKFYGFNFTQDGLKADESKIDAIKNMPTPTNKKDLQRFLGMINYLSRFIKNLSTESVILRRLTLDKTPWQWKQEEEEEYKKLKNMISDISTLKYYDIKQPIVLECDASSTGLGAVIFQDDRVVAYASRTLTKTEQNYAMIEKELLAIVFACIRFDQLIVGNPKVTVKTDHKPLITIFNRPLLKAPKRLQLMLMVLQRYKLYVLYVKGKNNVVADALSRAIINQEVKNGNEINENCDIENRNNVFKITRYENYIKNINLIENLNITDERIDSIRKETKNEATLQKVMMYIQDGWPEYIRDVAEDTKIYYKFKNELSIQDGLIFRNDSVVVPIKLRKLLVDKVHIGHSGIENTINLAKNNIFWPGMIQQIIEKVRSCRICLKYSKSQQKLPMMSHEIPTYPWQFVSMDIFFQKYEGYDRKILVIVDHYSDMFECNFLNDLTPGSVINIMKQHFARYGVPVIVKSDNGTHFVNKQMQNFSNQFNFRHETCSPYHQQGNGKAEAAVKIAKNLLKKANEENQDFWWMLLHWRNTPNKIGSSPVQRCISRKTRNSLPTTAEHLKPHVVNDVPEKIEQQRRKSKFYYDRKTKDLPELVMGQNVMVQLRPDTNAQWSEGSITNKTSDRSYMVKVNNVPYRRDRVHIRAVPENRKSTNDENINTNTDEENIDTNAVNDQHVTINESTPIAPMPTESSTVPVRPKRNAKLPSKYVDFDCNY